jgi:hypothetical protein
MKNLKEKFNTSPLNRDVITSEDWKNYELHIKHIVTTITSSLTLKSTDLLTYHPIEEGDEVTCNDFSLMLTDFNLPVPHDIVIAGSSNFEEIQNEINKHQELLWIGQKLTVEKKGFCINQY